MKKIYRLTEHNDWEGETWHFYLWMSEEQRAQMAKMIDEDVEFEFELSEKTYTEDEMRNLVAESGSGYMAYHNECGVLQDLPPDVESLYKGGIRDFCGAG